MAFNVIEASEKITKKYKRYLKTMFDIADPEYKKLFVEKIEKVLHIQIIFYTLSSW